MCKNRPVRLGSGDTVSSATLNRSCAPQNAQRHARRRTQAARENERVRRIRALARCCRAEPRGRAGRGAVSSMVIAQGGMGALVASPRRGNIEARGGVRQDEPDRSLRRVPALSSCVPRIYLM